MLAVIRLLRRDPLQNVLAGFLGVGIAAFLAARTGRAEDVFLPGLLVNLGYGLAFLVSILVRWPLLGVFVGLVSGQGMSWRNDPDLARAYARASTLWVGMFALRLVVQVPLYLAGDEQLGWLAGARLVMSWPLFLLVAYVSWLIVRPAYRAQRRAARQRRSALSGEDPRGSQAAERSATSGRRDPSRPSLYPAVVVDGKDDARGRTVRAAS